MDSSPIELFGRSSSEPLSLREVTARLHPEDNVAIAKRSLQAGLVLQTTSGRKLAVQQLVPAGHKIALREIGAGDAVRRYGQTIGFAREPISPGQHVHSHNVGLKDFSRDYAFCQDARPTAYIPEADRRSFMGFQRASGRVGTRNTIAVIGSVNCSAHGCHEITRHFTAERLASYPNVDEVIALTHDEGCGGVHSGTRDYAMLQRTLAGMARHPNVGATVLVGLGCEINQLNDLIERQQLDDETAVAPELVSLVIQDLGGIGPTVQAGIAAIDDLLPAVNAVQRSSQPVSELTIALECGGSDSWSGITANPLVGLVSDALIRQGGTVVLAETPEVYGVEHLLTRRAISPEVGQKLLDKIDWWQAYLRDRGVEFDNNPGPGNKAGGLSNIVEKSLGAIVKSGSTNLVDVYDYAEQIERRGFVFMDTPGYDPVSVTGMVAGGCNLVLFTTGRGSVFGFKPAPSIKISTNSPTFERMPGDMDFDAGRVLEKDGSLETLAAELFDLIVDVASGAPSRSEAQNVGTLEFVPWRSGPIV
ncbi:MAG: altronate dehydratase family protein [Chloroflexota bacterium]|nr:altronate dehydratase family protein [Chloroflexota bacterium]